MVHWNSDHKSSDHASDPGSVHLLWQANMAKTKDSLKERLARYREIDISVTGRKSGKESTRPVWFVLDGNTLDLLPVQGSETEWFKNVQKNPRIRISARGEEGEFRAKVITDSKAVASVVERFRQKYGAADVKKYYSNFDVAVELDLSLD
jgi:deazaflavin-dependent oxidoreductase (nitroreductase family)